MTEQQKKELLGDPDGLLTYEYIANNIDSCMAEMDFLMANLERVDAKGQFLVSTAKYLNAIDPEEFGPIVASLVEKAIEKDRERRYIADILPALYGPDYKERAKELSLTDNNFRRIYKRIYPTGTI